MQLSVLSETLIGSEIVKLGGEIREKIRRGEKIYNFTVGDFDPAIFPIPKELENGIVDGSNIADKQPSHFGRGKSNGNLRICPPIHEPRCRRV